MCKLSCCCPIVVASLLWECKGQSLWGLGLCTKTAHCHCNNNRETEEAKITLSFIKVSYCCFWLPQLLSLLPLLLLTARRSSLAVALSWKHVMRLCRAFLRITNLQSAPRVSKVSCPPKTRVWYSYCSSNIFSVCSNILNLLCKCSKRGSNITHTYCNKTFGRSTISILIGHRPAIYHMRKESYEITKIRYYTNMEELYLVILLCIIKAIKCSMCSCLPSSNFPSLISL